MSKTPNRFEPLHSEQTHDHEHHHDHSHDWASADYVAKWAQGQDRKEANRQEAFVSLANNIPYDVAEPITILDLGAGYGALTQFLLKYFPKATVVCQDGSEEMAKLGRERMKEFEGRFAYVIADFSRYGWSKLTPGPFEAIVSSIAIHNVNSPNIIRNIYQDALELLKPGGCFLNFDRLEPPLQDQLKWLKQAGFVDPQCFWKSENRAVFGGFRKHK